MPSQVTILPNLTKCNTNSIPPNLNNLPIVANQRHSKTAPKTRHPGHQTHLLRREACIRDKGMIIVSAEVQPELPLGVDIRIMCSLTHHNTRVLMILA
jgi:hypothetical protein